MTEKNKRHAEFISASSLTSLSRFQLKSILAYRQVEFISASMEILNKPVP
jgi:hypothetical protein